MAGSPSPWVHGINQRRLRGRLRENGKWRRVRDCAGTDAQRAFRRPVQQREITMGRGVQLSSCRRLATGKQKSAQESRRNGVLSAKTASCRSPRETIPSVNPPWLLSLVRRTASCNPWGRTPRCVELEPPDLQFRRGPGINLSPSIESDPGIDMIRHPPCRPGQRINRFIQTYPCFPIANPPLSLQTELPPLRFSNTPFLSL